MSAPGPAFVSQTFFTPQLGSLTASQTAWLKAHHSEQIADQTVLSTLPVSLSPLNHVSQQLLQCA